MKKIVSLIFFLTCTSMAFAQNNNTFGIRFNHLALAVKDLNRSVEFYVNTFHLQEITNRTANPTIRWVSLNDGKELHLITNTEPVKLTKTIHLAFSTSNLEDLLKRLKELKVPYGDWGGKENAVTTRADGVKQIYLQDPDGYWIEVNNAAD